MPGEGGKATDNLYFFLDKCWWTGTERPKEGVFGDYLRFWPDCTRAKFVSKKPLFFWGKTGNMV